MFVLARVFNRMNGGDDVYWKSERLRSGQTETHEDGKED
jgi:cob(I)alamin adenosyltransferase